MARTPVRDSRLRPWLPVFVLVAVLLLVVAVTRTSGSTSSDLANGAPAPSPSPSVPVGTEQRVALFLGGSATAGAGASSGAARWTSLVSERLGWRELNLGRIGTGYTASPPPVACGYSECPSLPFMALRVADEEPDVVVIAGGHNDTVIAHDHPELEREAIAATFSTVRAAAPDAVIVAVGPAPIWGTGPTLLAIDAEVRAAAASVCGVFVSLVDPQPLAPGFLAQDGVHVGDAGHEAIATRVLAALQDAGTAAEAGCGTSTGSA